MPGSILASALFQVGGHPGGPNANCDGPGVCPTAEGFTEALPYELQQFHIHVSLIEPGFVKTNFAGQRPTQLIDDYAVARQAALQFTSTGIARGIQPDVVAQTILVAATTPHPRLRYPVGRQPKLLLALKRLLPEPAFERLRRRRSA